MPIRICDHGHITLRRKPFTGCPACLKGMAQGRPLKTSRRQTGSSAHRARRLRVIHAYGGRCFCCGETEEAFLCIHHVNRDGAAHRKMLKARGTNLYAWLIANRFPKGFAVSCYNCNMAWERPGGCPHQRTRGRVRLGAAT